MHRATQFASVKMVQLLLEHGGDVRTNSNDPTSPLHCVLDRGRPLRMDRGRFSLSNQDMEMIVRALLLHGADVNAHGYRGQTPLQAAVLNCKSYGVVKILLDHGADISKTDNEGQNALHSLADRPGASSVRNKICTKILEHVSHDFVMVWKITEQVARINFDPDHDPDLSDSDSDVEDDDIGYWTAFDLAEIYELPGLGEILHAAQKVAMRRDQVYDAQRAKRKAKTAEDDRQRKTAVAMALHSRLGAESEMSMLGTDNLGIISKNISTKLQWQRPGT